MAEGFAMVNKKSVLIKAFSKSHFASLAGIFVFVFIVSSAVCALISTWHSTNLYEAEQLKLSGYKDVTFWISKLKDADPILSSIENLELVGDVSSERIIFADYEMNQKESDSEAQLIVYENDNYKFFKMDSKNRIADFESNSINITNGTVYLPASMISGFNAKIGDEIHIVTARNGVRTAFKVAGFFEDPVAGSTMIGMKRFLINSSDYENLCMISDYAGIDGLARTGFLIHVEQAESESKLSDVDFVKYLNQNTRLPRYTEQVHSQSVILGFMMLLQNIFTAIFAAFVIVLLVVTICVLIHTIKSDIQSERKNCGILKELGYSEGKIADIFALVFIAPVVLGMCTGFAFSFVLSDLIVKMLITSSGLLVQVRIPIIFCCGTLLFILLILIISVIAGTNAIKNIAPLEAVVEFTRSEKPVRKNELHKNCFQFHLAIRQIITKKSAYVGVLVVSLLLVFFASMAGRLDSWLGKNGEGLMDAFNPANHHLGVQSFGQATLEDLEKIIQSQSEITEYYVLAMPMLILNGTNYKANVISAPNKFHILRGKTCAGKNEVVITEFLLADLGLKIGDTVVIASRTGRDTFTISGTYQCANDMGANFGITQEAYLAIAEDNPAIWCHHYFIREPEKRIAIMETLEETYGTEIHVHENAWPGLYSILSAMKLLIMCMYILSAVFVISAVFLSTRKLLKEEELNLKRYQLLGYKTSSLGLSFVLRFVIVCALGAVNAFTLSCIFTDPLANVLVRMAGISGFESHPTILQSITPIVILIFSAAVGAWGFFKISIKK